MSAPPAITWALRILRVSGMLVPAPLRAEWRREWEAELAATADAHSPAWVLRAALGSFADAFWLRQREAADAIWLDDLRHGWRQLRQQSGFTVTAVGILAIGMAASVTAFSVVSQILLRPLPYPEPDRIVTIWERQAAQTGRLDVSPGNYLDWKARTTSFTHLAAAEPYSKDYTSGDRPASWNSANVTDGFFETFGVRPQLGRLFLHDEYEHGREQVVLLSAGLWQSRFGGDPSVVGRTIVLDELPYEIVGVLPDDFSPFILEDVPGDIVAWNPKVIEDYDQKIRASGYWQVVGRLAPGRSIADAEAEMDAIARQLEQEYPRTNTDSRVSVLPLREHLVGDVRRAITLFGGAVLLVLLIACVNVTNLMLARGAARQHELSIRTALGANRRRLVWQLLVESLLLSTLAAVLAVFIAHLTTQALARLGPPTLIWVDTLHVDGTALLFAGVLTIIVALVAGIVPAVRLASRGLQGATHRTATGDRQQRRLRSGLVVAEIALALMLVSGTALLLRSFVNLVTVDTGFRRDGVLAMQVFAWDRNPGPDELRRFFDDALARLEALPGVNRVGAVSAMPFIEANIDIRSTFQIVGDPPPAEGEAPRTSLTIASPGYFDVMNMRLTRGRGLTAADGPDRPRVAVISEALAARYWPGRDPIGQHAVFRFQDRLQGDPTDVEIVGVVGSLRHERLDEPARAELFMPLAQVPYGSMTFVVRTSLDPRSLVGAAQAAIWDTDPMQTVSDVATLDELVGRTVTARRFALAVLTGFAAIALLLAAAGLYGVLSAVAAQYRREIGVRMALGARWSDIVRMLLARGLSVAVLGVIIGVAGALGGAHLLGRFLYSVAPTDPLAIGGAALLMLVIATPACYLPARHAANEDPVEALRME